MSSATSTYERIAFIASPIPEAQEAFRQLSSAYGSAPPAAADVFVALGGDGLMLQTLHHFMRAGKPIYGMHRGTVGFLMNEFARDKLRERLEVARTTVIHPLLMCAYDIEGKTIEFHAFNEVSMFRQSYQAARLRILIDEKERLLSVLDKASNTKTGEVLRLPFVNSDMRFMQGVFRGTDGKVHRGAFAFV